MGLAQYQYNEHDSDWFGTFLARVEKQSKGFNGITLTNYSTTSVCAIASGSIVEINGALFIASSVTTITGSVSTGEMYIICSVTGTTASPYWSTVVGTWDEDKQGIYTGNERYIGECHYGTNGTEYQGKYIYPSNQRDLIRKIPIGDWNMDTIISVTVNHGLGANYKIIRSVAGIIRDDADSGYTTIPCASSLGGGSVGAAIWSIITDDITITRSTGGVFDNTSYNALSYNRGWITMFYEI